MTGVLLVNMGGARSEQEMKTFLANMFRDPGILPFGKPVRNLLSFIISNARYRKSWKKYELIGGTPIIDATLRSVESLQEKLKKGYRVKMAFSYSSPTIKESMLSFKSEGIKKVVVIPLYPQTSFTTTKSVEDDIHQINSAERSFDIRLKKGFYKREGYINFWFELISAHIQKHQLNAPLLLFSAHSIPRYLVKKGDTYPKEIMESAMLIALKLGLDYDVTYQSGMRSGKWIGPDVMVSLSKLAVDGKKEIVIIPISFVNENLETLYDIDKVIIPAAQTEHGFAHLSRISIPEANETFITLLADIVKK